MNVTLAFALLTLRLNVLLSTETTMDCEKYEPLLLDELYDELDELTSAAVKRHVAGCARCAAILSGFRGTREAAMLPLVAIPDGLEDRILAATREAQKVVPIRSRMSRVLAVAGSWAMRPQTAMAAVFLLMIGSSAFLLRSTNSTKGRSAASVSVTVVGDPAPVAAAPAQDESIDDKAAASAHGPTPPVFVRPPPAAPSAVALGESEIAAPGAGAAPTEKKKDDADVVAALEQPRAMKASAARPAPTVGLDRAEGYAEPPATAARSGAGSQSASASNATAGQDAKSLGAAEYRARNYAEAARQYGIAAQNGDQDAALWAAQSTQDGQGCAVALGRFDQLARSAAGTYYGDQAALRAARCEMNMGQYDGARARLDRLAQAPATKPAATQMLAELNQVAAKKAGGGSVGGAAAAPAAAPPRAASPAPMKQQQRATDKAGF